MEKLFSNLDACKTPLLTAVKHRPRKIHVRHYSMLWVMLHLFLPSQHVLELQKYIVVKILLFVLFIK